jgi:PAS domain S-box-containing protein
LTLRATIALTFALAFASIAIVGVALSLRVVPNAAEITRRGALTQQDYAARTRLATQLDSSLTDLWSQLRRARQAPLPADTLRLRRERLDRIVRSSGLLEPIGRTTDIANDFIASMERADRASSAMAAALLGVVAALELRDIPSAERLLSQADSLDAPLAAQLNAVTLTALAGLARDEARLEREARFAAFLVLGWLLIGLLGAPFLWRLLQRRLFSPLLAIERALHRIDSGDLEVEVPVHRQDELGRLGAHFNHTTQVLRTQRVQAERMAARAALEASEARYRAAFEQAAVGLAEIGTDGAYLRVNRAMCAFLGRDHDAIIGRRFSDFTHPDDLAADAVEWPQFVAGGRERVARLERRYLRPDGTSVVAQVTATMLLDVDGTPRHVLSVVQDVTEQRRLERELLQSMKLEAVGQLAGGVAHDFNNLLAGIIGYAELLEHDAANAPDVRDDAAVIRKAALRGADLARSLLTLARRTPQQATEPFAVEPLLRETADLARRTFDRRIEIVVVAEETTTIVGDRSLLSNALLNLLLNARDAMPNGGSIVLESRQAQPDAAFRERHALPAEARFVAIHVRDTGCGMSPEVVEHVFEPFFTTKEPGKGTGLGLSMVYGTVKGHHGAITLESEVGRGTHFTILLPHADDDAAASAPARAAVPATSTARVLLVDDDAMVRDVGGRMLRRLGYAVELANDGRAALDRLAREDHGMDVVILDGNMPRLNGLETARQLHARHPALPLVYASGYFDPDVREDLAVLGFRERLAKPYTMEALSRAVARCLGREVEG